MEHGDEQAGQYTENRDHPEEQQDGAGIVFLRGLGGPAHSPDDEHDDVHDGDGQEDHDDDPVADGQRLIFGVAHGLEEVGSGDHSTPARADKQARLEWKLSIRAIL